MFTGIVEEVGEIVAVLPRGDVQAVVVRAPRVARDLPLGASVAVNGCCLTAVEVQAGDFTCELTAETLARTAFGSGLSVGRRVNLERPLRADGRFDGHIVQGHVDGVGEVREMRRTGAAAELLVAAPPEVARYLVAKGSVAVDGISLTVAGLQGADFRVALIPYTLEWTTLGEAGPGDRVNLEADVIAKYVERLLPPFRA
jgi:riboflavin synthase